MLVIKCIFPCGCWLSGDILYPYTESGIVVTVDCATGGCLILFVELQSVADLLTTIVNTASNSNQEVLCLIGKCQLQQKLK